MEDDLAVNPYSALKVLHHHDRIKDLKAGTHINPISIRMVLSDLCIRIVIFVRLEWRIVSQISYLVVMIKGEI